MSSQSKAGPARVDGRMPTTRTGLVRLAQRGASPEGIQAALAELCSLYWKPVHAFIRYRRGADEATDLTQGFMAELLARGVNTYDSLYGGQPRRFRSWLLGAVTRFLSRQRQREHADKRDARKTHSLDELLTDGRTDAGLSYSTPPERAFVRSFAACLIDQAWTTTREWYAGRGKVRRFDLLERFIPGDEVDDFAYEPVADELGISAVAVRRAVMDLRRRYRANLLRHVRDTVPREEDLDDELRFLFHEEQDSSTERDGA
jgi:DNA-directed RNA polymerase specialized sigma24 family protein